MSNLHNRIMNIPMNLHEDENYEDGYAYGHRDARHAAAEIAAEIDGIKDQLISDLKDHLERNQEVIDNLMGALGESTVEQIRCRVEIERLMARETELKSRIPNPNDLKLILGTLNARLLGEPVSDFFYEAYHRLRSTLPKEEA